MSEISSPLAICMQRTHLPNTRVAMASASASICCILWSTSVGAAVSGWGEERWASCELKEPFKRAKNLQLKEPFKLGLRKLKQPEQPFVGNDKALTNLSLRGNQL